VPVVKKISQKEIHQKQKESGQNNFRNLPSVPQKIYPAIGIEMENQRFPGRLNGNVKKRGGYYQN
jgi:hypothetical protein